MKDIEMALAEEDSFAFTCSRIPQVVEVNRSGTEKVKMKMHVPIRVFTIAVGDTDAVQAFRDNRDAFMRKIGAQRAIVQAKKIGL